MLNHFLNRVPVGFRYMLLSTLGFALMLSSVKLVYAQGIPVFEIIAARCVVSLVISYVDTKRKGISIWGNNKKLLFARGFIGSLALICGFYTVATLPLAEATILQYLNPAFTAILSIAFLKEKVQTSTVTCIVCSIFGLLLIVNPGLHLDGLSALELPLFSVTTGLLGAFGSAVAYMIVRQLVASDDTSVIIFYFPMIALPLSIFLLGDGFVMPDGKALVLLLFIGVFTQVGQVYLTKAMQTEVASKATAYSYLQVVFSIILGWLLFSELPSLWTWAGGSLIILGALANLFGSLGSKSRPPSKEA